MTVKPPCICRYYKIKTKGTQNTNPTKRINEKYPLLLFVFLSLWNINGRNRNSDRDRDRGQELPAENSNEEKFGKEAIFATRFLDAVSQQLSSRRSNKRSSARRRRVSDEFPVSASHSHSPPQQALPPPHVLCHGFNNAAVVDGSCSCSCSCSAACFVCVRGKRLVMSSTILCFDGK